jgi:hypothetical protein
MAATFIVVGIVLVPIVLLLADLLVGRNRVTSSTSPMRRRTR